jgi:hypothetical protein
VRFSVGPTCFDVVVQVVCITTEGMTKTNLSASGNVLDVTFLNNTTTVTRPSGELVQEATTDQRQVLVGNHGALQVLQQAGTRTFTIDGTTCTFEFNFTFANGDTRHNMTSSQCTPA